MDSCYDVFVLHDEFAQDPLPVEAVFNDGATHPVCFCRCLLWILVSMDARGSHMEELYCYLRASLRNGQSICAIHAFLQKNV